VLQGRRRSSGPALPQLFSSEGMSAVQDLVLQQASLLRAGLALSSAPLLAEMSTESLRRGAVETLHRTLCTVSQPLSALSKGALARVLREALDSWLDATLCTWEERVLELQALVTPSHGPALQGRDLALEDWQFNHFWRSFMVSFQVAVESGDLTSGDAGVHLQRAHQAAQQAIQGHIAELEAILLGDHGMHSARLAARTIRFPTLTRQAKMLLPRVKIVGGAVELHALLPSTGSPATVVADSGAHSSSDTASHMSLCDVLVDVAFHSHHSGAEQASMVLQLRRALAQLFLSKMLQQAAQQSFEACWGEKMSAYLSRYLETPVEGSVEGLTKPSRPKDDVVLLEAFTELYCCTVDVFVSTGTKHSLVYRIGSVAQPNRSFRVLYRPELRCWGLVQARGVQLSEAPPQIREFELTEEEREQKRRSAEEVQAEEQAALEAKQEVEERVQSRPVANGHGSSTVTKSLLLSKIV